MTQSYDTQTVIIHLADGEVVQVEGISPDSIVIVRDWDKGNTPDANGDLYEDRIITEVNHYVFPDRRHYRRIQE